MIVVSYGFRARARTGSLRSAGRAEHGAPRVSFARRKICAGSGNGQAGEFHAVPRGALRGRRTIARGGSAQEHLYFGSVVAGRQMGVSDAIRGRQVSHLAATISRAEQPEQVTSGPTAEEGIAMAADGKSLITSVGVETGTVWIHDGNGEHQVSSEGDANGARFSADGKKLYYMMDNGQTQGYELWVRDVASGTTDRALPGYTMHDFDVCANGKELAFSKADENGHSKLWVSPLNRRSSPRQISSTTIDDQRPLSAGRRFAVSSDRGRSRTFWSACTRMEAAGRK